MADNPYYGTDEREQQHKDELRGLPGLRPLTDAEIKAEKTAQWNAAIAKLSGTIGKAI